MRGEEQNRNQFMSFVRVYRDDVLNLFNNMLTFMFLMFTYSLFLLPSLFAVRHYKQ